MGIGARGAEREKVSRVLAEETPAASEELANSDETVLRVRDAVDRWAQQARRDLPWRLTRDPWAIVVSETMLQQTQAPRVVPKYERFMARFPTVTACAQAGVGEVVDAWAGLGYNRRAVYLHRLAVAVVERHHGQIPDDIDALLVLPGIGAYTARAVLAFAFERDVGVIDTNIGRVLARLSGHRLRPLAAQRLADRLVPHGGGWEWNQSMLDLGALICTAQSPRCAQCPVRSVCRWRGEGADPARESFGVSRGQSRFAGSDRQGRGRLVDALRRGPVLRDALAYAAGWPDDGERAERVAESLVTDGLACWAGDELSLP
ncbi:MAG: A/G-specific adenine glycosylase [Acidimicrobiales bacterium]